MVYESFLTTEELNEVGFYLQPKYNIDANFTGVATGESVPEPASLILILSMIAVVAFLRFM